MNRCQLDELPWTEQRSPSGKFRSFCRNLSIDLGAPRNTGLEGGGHPFDVQIRRIPPGAAVCPFHSHLAQWELFVVRSGHGTVRAGAETHTVSVGDVFVHPPTEPHQLINTGTSDLEVLIIADNPPLDSCYYPDSAKWSLRPPGKFFRPVDCDYFDGEDELPATSPVAPGTATFKPAPPAEPPALTPFAQRKLSLDALAWENFDSPKRKFRGESKAVSAALGAQRNTPTGLGGHPFDLELGRLPPGFSGCPYHSHAAQWEFYIFLSGTGTFRTADGLAPVGPGDVVLQPPGSAHQFTNTGTTPLEYFLIADNPAVDIWFYPDANKWGFSSPRKFFRMTETPYWDEME